MPRVGQLVKDDRYPETGWVSRPVDLKRFHSRGRIETVRVDGEVHGTLAVHASLEQDALHHVTHLPTGLAVARLVRRDDAKALAELLWRTYRAALDQPTQEAVRAALRASASPGSAGVTAYDWLARCYRDMRVLPR